MGVCYITHLYQTLEKSAGSCTGDIAYGSQISRGGSAIRFGACEGFLAQPEGRESVKSHQISAQPKVINLSGGSWEIKE